MKKSRVNRWIPAAGVVLVLSLWISAGGKEATPPENKSLTRTQKELLFRENGLKKDHFFGYTNLILASLQGDLPGVEKALKNGDKVNWKMEWGYTALMLAADRGHLQIVRLLVENGAEVKLTNDEGKTAFDLARREGHSNVEAYLVSVQQHH
ncbi:MAG: ankyrin repeat domain-containing protein [Phycisphaerae bacterium]|nr:ankyrin repeat domain-containing protein [Phycisphaerae bacterium]